jgi:hypothetical protein
MGTEPCLPCEDSTDTKPATRGSTVPKWDVPGRGAVRAPPARSPATLPTEYHSLRRRGRVTAPGGAGARPPGGSLQRRAKRKRPQMTPDRNGGSDLDPETVGELRRLARSRCRGRAARRSRRRVRCGRWSGRAGGSVGCRRRPMAGIRIRPATRSTSLIACSCRITPRSCGAIGRRRGARGECECPVATPAVPRLSGLLDDQGTPRSA